VGPDIVLTESNDAVISWASFMAHRVAFMRTHHRGADPLTQVIPVGAQHVALNSHTHPESVDVLLRTLPGAISDRTQATDRFFERNYAVFEHVVGHRVRAIRFRC